MKIRKSFAGVFVAVLVVCSVSFFSVGCGGGGGGTDGPKKLYLFGTDVRHDGNIGGRAGADEACLTDANMPADATVAHAFISVTEDDCIANMPVNYNFPANIPIVAPDGVTVIADNWDDLLDGGIKVSLVDAGLMTEVKSSVWWSGSNQDGTLHSANCSEWTISDVSISCWVGGVAQTGSRWISDGNVASFENSHLLGIAY